MGRLLDRIRRRRGRGKPKAPAILKINAEPIRHLRREGREPFVPGRIYVRFRRDAVRAIPRKLAFARRIVDAVVPDAIQDPLRYLIENCGLSDAEPTFARPRAKEALGRAEDRLALSVGRVAQSVHETKHRLLEGFTTLTLDRNRVSEATLKLLRRSRAVELAERVPNRWLAAKKAKLRPDPSLLLQWGLWELGWKEAKRPPAASVHVAVLDTGIDADHPDLKGAIESYTHTGNSPRDFIGHGTHVAGIIAAVAENGIGISGVSNARIHAYKVFDDPPRPGGDALFNDSTYNAALAEALEGKIAVVNLSIGGTESSETEAQIFAALRDEGKLVVAAMGNEFEEGNPVEYPGAYDNVLAVGAVGQDLKRAAFSNTGKHIGISAPGVGILSTLPLKPFKPERAEVEYAAWDGTSMAAPCVAGVAALVFAKFPGKGAAWVERRLLAKARKLPAMKGKAFSREYGRGLVSILRSL